MIYLLIPTEEQVVPIRVWKLAHTPGPQVMRNILPVPVTHGLYSGLSFILLSPPGGEVGIWRYRNSRKVKIKIMKGLHLTKQWITFLWSDERCQILCIFCYFRLPWGNRNDPLARATLPIPLYFLQHSCQGRPLRSGNLKLPEIQRNW